MEVFMRGVPYTISEKQLVRRFAEILHSDEYREFSPDTLMNFRVRLNRNQRGQRFRNGFLSLPSVPAGQKFLLQYGGTEPLRNFNIGRIVFALGNNPIRADILGELRCMPYVDPDIIEAQERLIQEFESGVVKIQVVQFGWECRDLDGVFSAEHEAGYGRGYISFQDDPREIRIHMETKDRMYTNVAAIAFGQIQYISVGLVHHQPIIFFSLQRAPVYETEMSSLDARLAQLSLGDFSSRGYIRGPRRIRRTAFDPQHADVVAYTSLAIRLVCASEKDLQLFRSLCQTAGLADWVKRDPPQDEYREIFCRSNREDLAAWLEDLEWEVAFQVQLLTRRLYVDLVEILSLQNEIDTYYERHGSRPTSDLLRLFASQVRDLFYHDQDEEQVETVHQCFMRCKDELDKSKPKPIRVSRANDDIFDCYHVMVTPSTYRLEGPFPERLNRVIRKYIDHSECFVRVSFVDENQLQYRFDRDVDGTEFIQRHVGSKLRDLTIAGQRLEFLAYSQSALKEHSVWYIRPFFDIKAGHVVDAARVIKSLGNFHNLTFDPNMGYCPARYAARISQSFTATDSSVSMEVEEVILLDDIQRFGSCFTDGVGTISLELAKAIRGALYNKARRRRRPLVKPSAFQIRFQGAKGMLSVDYKLKGRSICLRPSMIKFEAPNSNDIEIAQAFDRPSRYYLNRPLIMLLEGLGVPYRVFEAYQNTAVKDAEDAIESLVRTARLLEGHGLGTSFRLPSVLLNIQQKLGVTRIQDPFYRRMQEFAIHHVLREMKHKARIPIPGGFILVGVADIHGYLGPRDIFACTRCPECRKDVFFEGPTLVSRSPTIHPGDVQVLNAIGRPPEGSPFEREALKNCIVFSTKGERAIPSFLGGGDLDGDTYNVWSPSCVCKCTERWTHLHSYPLLPRTANQEPGSYIAAEKKLVDHLCNMDDVKDFFVDYITSDVLGLVATNWLLIADHSPAGIFDPMCYQLAQVHSDAVDYPKSGQPVAHTSIPRPEIKVKPDWHAPETVVRTAGKYYESTRAIGRLFRAITLPALDVVHTTRRRQRRVLQEGEQRSVEELVIDINYAGPTSRDFEDIQTRLASHVRASGYISLHACTFVEVQDAWDLFNTFSGQIHNACVAHSLAQARDAMLMEQELLVGTIVAKSSQPRKRKDVMAKMREVTNVIVRDARDELKGGEDSTLEEWLRRSWVAWKLANLEEDNIGGKSFWWVTLGSVFDAMRAIEEDSERMYDYA